MPSLIDERFPALRSADFRNLWIGQIVSAAGSQMQFWALNWQIYELTGSTIALGMIGLFRVIPILVFSLLGGMVADARDRRRILLLTQSVLAGVALCLAALTHTHHASAPALYLLTAVGAAALAFDNPARQALVPSLVPRENLTNAMALNSTGFQVATICGPMLAGLVIGKFGTSVAYLVNAVSFLAVLAALLGMRYRPAPAAPMSFDLGSLKEGLHFVWKTPILVSTMLLDFFATFFSSASALLPVFAREILNVGPIGYGQLAAAPAAGSLIAGFLLSTLPPFKRQGKVLLLAVCLYALATIGFGFSRFFWLSAAFLALTGVADTISTVLRSTIRQLVTPDHLRGRMVSVTMIFFMGGPQLGEFEAGLVAHWWGAVVSVVTGGIGCLIATGTIARLSPFLVRYRAPEPERRSPAER